MCGTFYRKSVSISQPWHGTLMLSSLINQTPKSVLNMAQLV